MVLPDSTINTFTVDKFDRNGEADGFFKVLILELKRGGHQIKLKDKYQAENYMNLFYKKGLVNKDALIDVFVLGTTIACDDSDTGPKKQNTIKIRTYAQVVAKAELRLFKLQEKIENNPKFKFKLKDSVMKDALSQKSLESFN